MMINVVISLDPSLLSLLSSATNTLNKISSNQGRMLTAMADIQSDIDDLTQKVASETTLVGSLQTFIQGMKDQIAGLGLTPTQQIQIDAIMSGMQSNADAISSAMAANTPAAPPTTGA
jgi:hypothetical protein